jgi:hypothetical protein
MPVRFFVFNWGNSLARFNICFGKAFARQISQGIDRSDCSGQGNRMALPPKLNF